MEDIKLFRGEIMNVVYKYGKNEIRKIECNYITLEKHGHGFLCSNENGKVINFIGIVNLVRIEKG